MSNCAICNKKLNLLNTAYGHTTSNNQPICLSCLKKGYKSPEDNEKDYKKVSNPIISLQTQSSENKKENVIKPITDYPSQKICKQSEYVGEYKRTCRECGKVWYSLESREKKLENQQCWNSCVTCSSSIALARGKGGWGGYAQSTHNEQTTDEQLNNLRQCPNCHSTNYFEVLVRHKKKK
jgi:hypothetical protein